MKKIFFLSILISTFFCLYSQQKTKMPGERFSLDKDWKFFMGDIPFPVIKGHNETYTSTKAGRATGAADPTYDDKNWREVNLPHDWALETICDSTENLSQGFKKRGISWYRRNFRMDPEDRGKHIELQFDGIATHATIWVNGIVVHRNWCGYTSSYIDITPLLKYGDEPNNIAVRVDANAQEGWWYEGAGIYRHVWLVKRAPVHIVTDGIYVNPIKKEGQWILPVEITLENSGKSKASAIVEISLYDTDNRLIIQKETPVEVKALDTSITLVELHIDNPQLWSVDHPVLYAVKSVVKQKNRIQDEAITRCGFRTIHFDNDHGFYLNDKPLKLKGTCNHIDHAGVGVAVPDALWEFRLRKLKEMGSNAYRCAHNPPSREFLDACDSIGILVMDENRNFNSSPEYIRQLQWLVRRDRNHPSIILWSVFNEEPMQGSEIGYEMVRRMSAEVKKLDVTRPVTAAMNGGFFTSVNVSQVADVVGFNYQPDSYDRFHKENPNVCMTSSEDVSAVMQRGQYVTDKSKNLLDSYDTQHPSWGTTHRNSWRSINERPFLAGCFVWTGFDYRGEPTPFKWPSVSSNFGIMDLCGFPKAAYYMYQAYWLDRPVLHIEPHWNWPEDSIGKNIKVMVISNAEKVKLILNGKTIGEQVVDKYDFNLFQVPYSPGKIEAVAYKNGKEINRYKLETTGEAAILQLLPDRESLAGNGWDAMPVTVRVTDKKGRPVPTANIPVTFSITGPGKIIGLGNGNPNSHEPDKGNKRDLFNGLAQAIIQSNENESGDILLTATSPGIKPVTVKIPVEAVEEIPFIPAENSELILDKWLMSPQSSGRPDPNKKLSDNDMNSWETVIPGQLQELKTGNYIMFRTFLVSGSNSDNKDVILTLRKLTGNAELWLDGELLKKKESFYSEDVKIYIPSGPQKQMLTILIQGKKGDKVGLGGIVSYSSKFDIFQSIPFSYSLSSFHGYDCADFLFEGRSAKIVKPRFTAKGKPWVWRARFFGHEPQTDIALLEKGFHIVFCDPSELFGNDEAISLWNRFYDFLHQRGLSSKAVMEGMSRGGVYIYNWAAQNPDKIYCIYADAPVLDLKSWPGGKGKSKGSPSDWEKFKRDYGYETEEQTETFRNNPLDKVHEIVKGGYPMLHVVGDDDDIVPVEENTEIFERKIKEAGGNIQVIHKPGVKHHPHSLKDPKPIVDFILKAVFGETL